MCRAKSCPSYSLNSSYERKNFFRNLFSRLLSILIIIHLIIILMMRDQQHKDDTCHDVEFLSKLHKMTIENTIKDVFEVRGMDCSYSRAM